ncbi:MAG: glycosyltransferase family 4 protein [Candidatus Campbellbacteria bacterium]|nr:glycosyltransferase family 4 protein [Candidatus Campbellbacteria bacterium]
MSQRIGVIVDPYEEHEPSGLAYVTAEYLHGLIQYAPQYEYVVYTKQPFTLFPLSHNVHNVIISKSFLGKNFYFLKEYFFHRERFPDVLIFNMPLLPLVLPKNIKTAVYCHEVLYEPETAGWKQWFVHKIWRTLAHPTMKRARVIFTATHATAQEIADTYHTSLNKIKVVPHGIREVPQDIAPQTFFKGPYFLFVGRTKYKKNMHGIIEGFIRFKERTHAPHILCLAGKTKDTPYLMGLIEEVSRRGFGGSLIRTGYVSEKELLSLLKSASAFVFCSLAEGFGLPIPEAMSVGVPVITSNIPVLSEVAGGAALLVDPYNPDTIASAMEKIISDTKLRTELVEKGLRHVQKYTWDTASTLFTQEIIAIVNT